MRKVGCQALIKAIAVLRGGAKQAAFATDVAPKALVFAGLSCGNPIFNRLFEESDAGVVMNLDRLTEIQKDYTDRLTTPIFVGIRKGYLANENQVHGLTEVPIPSFVVCTPIEAAAKMAAAII